MSMTGQPNSYSRTTGNHIIVFGSDGRRVADISAERIKFTTWNYNQRENKWIPSEGSKNKVQPIPEEIKKLFGLK